MPLPIGFFMPLPLPLMIPFMMWQSAAMADGFGTFFQYGKRRISAMSNEEFNALDSGKMADILNKDMDMFIARMPSSFNKMNDMNVVVMNAMVTFLEQAIQFGIDKLVDIGKQLGGGTPVGSGGDTINPFGFLDPLPPAYGDDKPPPSGSTDRVFEDFKSQISRTLDAKSLASLRTQLLKGNNPYLTTDQLKHLLKSIGSRLRQLQETQGSTYRGHTIVHDVTRGRYCTDYTDTNRNRREHCSSDLTILKRFIDRNLDSLKDKNKDPSPKYLQMQVRVYTSSLNKNQGFQKALKLAFSEIRKQYGNVRYGLTEKVSHKTNRQNSNKYRHTLILKFTRK